MQRGKWTSTFVVSLALAACGGVKPWPGGSHSGVPNGGTGAGDAGASSSSGGAHGGGASNGGAGNASASGGSSSGGANAGGSSNGGSSNGGANAGGSSSGGANDALTLGRQIFDSGTDASGQPISRNGGVGMMTWGGCASCHGSDGRGLTTMMFTTPNITYSNLTDPAGMVEPDGTRGPTYTDTLIRRAVVNGIGADGDTLDTTMPRWQLTDDEWNDLLAYMKTLN